MPRDQAACPGDEGGGGVSVDGDEGGHRMAHPHALLMLQQKNGAPSGKTFGSTCLLEAAQQYVVNHHIKCFGIVQEKSVDMASRFVQLCRDVMCQFHQAMGSGAASGGPKLPRVEALFHSLPDPLTHKTL